MIREATENVIRLAKATIHPNAVLVARDDLFEVTQTPSVILQGPTVTENRGRRSMVSNFCSDLDQSTFTEQKLPRLYHLDFDLVVTTATEAELLDFQETVARFYQTHPVLDFGDKGTLNLTELVPLGGLTRVNLSNLRQSAGRLRIEDCPVFQADVRTGRLIHDRIVQVRGCVRQDFTYPRS